MVLQDTLRKIVDLQQVELKKLDPGVKRELKVDFNIPHVIVISGIRRCGKSTLMRQLFPKHFNYFSFEDQRLVDFTVRDFEVLNQIFKEHRENDNYFFDEIQNVEQWERYIRRLLDEKKKCVVTGSNASMLSKELGTRLTGRHLTYELFPFSYQEMLAFEKKKPGIESFEDYLLYGGFPEYLKYRKLELLQELLRDVITRDIVIRYKIRDVTSMRKLAIFLLSNVGKRFSYTALAKMFNIPSVNTIISFLTYFEDSYLFFRVPKFDYSYKKQLLNSKKFYAIDSGLIKANTVSFSEDKGRILENIVFVHLRRKYRDIFYYEGKGECDFIVDNMAIQVSHTLTEGNKDKELAGLKEAMKECRCKLGIMLTYNQEDSLDDIAVIPLWKWLR